MAVQSDVARTLASGRFDELLADPVAVAIVEKLIELEGKQSPKDGELAELLDYDFNSVNAALRRLNDLDIVYYYTPKGGSLSFSGWRANHPGPASIFLGCLRVRRQEQREMKPRQRQSSLSEDFGL